MKRRNREGKETKIEIIPMIDTMFFLLVFFLLSALNIINLETLGMNLPKESNKAQKMDKVDAQLTVAIKNNGFIYVNNKSVTADEVGKALIDAATAQERIRTKKPDGVLTPDAIKTMPVVISAEMGVKHGIVVTCIDSARQTGIERFAIAVDRRSIPAGQ